MSVKSEVKLIYVTACSPEEADNIATILVAQKLAACANIIGPSTSIYWGEEGMQRAVETIFILKTKATLIEQAVAKIVELHSYECPAVIVLDVENANQNFLNWISKKTL